MASTNKTPHYELSQYISTDAPTWLGDVNGDMLKIDSAIFQAEETATNAENLASQHEGKLSELESNLNDVIEDVAQNKVAIQGLNSQLTFSQTTRSININGKLSVADVEGRDYKMEISATAPAKWGGNVLFLTETRLNNVKLYNLTAKFTPEGETMKPGVITGTVAGSKVLLIGKEFELPEFPTAGKGTGMVEILLSGTILLEMNDLTWEEGVLELVHDPKMGENMYVLEAIMDKTLKTLYDSGIKGNYDIHINSSLDAGAMIIHTE